MKHRQHRKNEDRSHDLENWSSEATVHATLDLVVAVLMKHFPIDPDDEEYLH